MALVLVGTDPTFSQNIDVEKGTENYLPRQPFNMPVWDKMLFYQAPKYWLTSFLTELTEGEPVAANQVNWAEYGKFYQKQFISATAVTGAGTLSMTIQLKATAGDQYFIPGDVIDLGRAFTGSSIRNLKARVTANGTNGGEETIDVQVLALLGDVSALTAADFPEDQEIVLLYHSKGECWTIPAGRVTAPDQFSNELVKIPNTHEMCDDAANRVIWFKNTVDGKFYWYPEELNITMEEHAREVDNSLLFGEQGTFTDGIYSGVQGKGILQFLEGSVKRSFSGNIIEDDIIDMLAIMSTFSKYNEWYFIVGVNMHKDFLKALKAYHTNAAVWYGPFKESGKGNTLGINVGTYIFGSQKINLMEYKCFGDPDFLPSTANAVDYTNFGMLLNLDAVEVCYKRRAKGGKMKNWISVQYGPTFNENGAPVQTNQACTLTNIFTHLGLKMKGLQSHGVILGT